jgi:hypothetical protein
MEENDKQFQNTLEDDLIAYKKSLLDSEKKMQESYDKSVITLSGGAIGISFTLFVQIITKSDILYAGWFVSAWLCWMTSIGCVMASFFTSVHAHRSAYSAVENHTIYLEHKKCIWTRSTTYLNYSGGALFLLGLMLVSVFIYGNMNQKKSCTEEQKQQNTSDKNSK